MIGIFIIIINIKIRDPPSMNAYIRMIRNRDFEANNQNKIQIIFEIVLPLIKFEL